MSRKELMAKLEALRMEEGPLYRLDEALSALLAYVDDEDITRLVDEVTP